MDTQKQEAAEKRLIRWLLIAALALLILVLGLQAWRMLFPGSLENSTQGPDQGATEPLNGPDGSVSPGRSAMIEDVRARNPALPFDGLAALTAEELEQLCEAAVPPDSVPIGLSQAVYLAEQYAGTLEADSITYDVDPELDENPAHYKVELHHITLGDFDYKVDACTGEVLEGQANLLGSVPAASEPDSSVNYSAAQAPAAQTPASQPQGSAAENAQAPGQTQPAAQSGPTDEDAAKAAAFTHAGVREADVTNLRIKLDWEDRVQVYEIEFISGGKEYDYEIDAATGAVLKAEQEQEHARGAQSGSRQTGSFIGEAAAKAAALAHAGVSEADAGYIQCKLDQDDGRWCYEIEFCSGGVEYEYEIDASAGTVLKAEMDR